MIKRDVLVKFLNDYFLIEKYGPDPSMSRMVPMVYENFEWDRYFTQYFFNYFNGLMIEGGENINTVFGSVFPTEEVLKKFIKESEEGDFLFLHHPIDMECGDPRGLSGRAFLPIKKEQLDKIIQKKLSIYSCHHPLDCHNEINTNLSIARKLNIKNKNHFINFAGGFVGLLGEIDLINSTDLENELKDIFDIPYIDFGGKAKDKIIKVAIVAGSGDKVDFFKEAEENNVDAYITGEIHSHIDNERGKDKMKESLEYINNSNMSFFGVSHAASEFLVIKNEVLPLISNNFNVLTKDLPLANWWH